MLSTGPGPGSLLAAGAAWRSLAAQYADAATQLTGVLATVQAGVWDGLTADQYVAAHQPFLAWLTSMSAVAEAVGQRHDAVAGAYLAALTAMPTLAELTANHAVHTTLLATNFLGLNTIPIALNEADYIRMWIQAATTMSVYQGVSAVHVESAPTASVAPAIVSSDAPVSGTSAASPTAQFSFRDPAGIVVEQVRNIVNGLAEWARELPEPLRGMVSQVLDGAAAAVNAKLFSILTYSILDPLIYFGPFTTLLTPAAAAAAAAAAVPVADQVPELGSAPAPASPALAGNNIQDRSDWHLAGSAPVSMAAPATSVSGTGSAPTSAAAPAAQPANVPYLYAVGAAPGGEGSAPTVRDPAAQVVSAPVQEPVATVVAVAERRAARRRRKSRQSGYETMAGDGRMTLSDVPGQPHAVESDRGAALVVSARGLVGRREPTAPEVARRAMLPSTWS